MREKTVTMQGEGFTETMTQTEYLEWVKYDDSHPQLARLPYRSVLQMFLSHYRRGINLNLPLQP